MIVGISHITFVVKDLEHTAHFLKEIFGAKEVFSSLDVKYFQINDLWLTIQSSITPIILDRRFLLQNGCLAHTFNKLRFVGSSITTNSSDGIKYQRLHHFFPQSAQKRTPVSGLGLPVTF